MNKVKITKEQKELLDNFLESWADNIEKGVELLIVQHLNIGIRTKNSIDKLLNSFVNKPKLSELALILEGEYEVIMSPKENVEELYSRHCEKTSHYSRGYKNAIQDVNTVLDLNLNLWGGN